MRFSAAVFLAASVVVFSTGSDVCVHAETGLEPAVAESEVFIAVTNGNVTLNVEEADITSVLRLLSDTKRINIVAGPGVSGNVSVNLYNVPFDQALDSILGVAGCISFKKGEIIYVTTEDERSNLPLGTNDLVTKIYSIQYGEPEVVLQTVLPFLSRSGTATLSSNRSLVVRDTPEYIEVVNQLVSTAELPPQSARAFEVGHVEPEDIEEAISQSLSSTGTITLVPNNKIVVQDTPEHIEVIADLIAQLDTPPRQVLISAKILNIRLEDGLELGTEFQYSSIPYEGSPYTDDRRILTDSTEEGVKALPGDFDRWLNDVSRVSTGAEGIATMIIREHVQLFIDALSTRNDVEALASPQLLALDGEVARIQVGERLGFRVLENTETSTLENVEFLDVGTVLEVTPHIAPDDLIRLDISPKVSTGEINPDGLPEERTTEAETSMIVRDGETIVIGGLLNLARQKIRSQVPILGDIPVLGYLFGRKTWTDRNSELIILITPFLSGPEGLPSMEDDITRVEISETRLSERKSDAQKLFEGMPSTR